MSNCEPHIAIHHLPGSKQTNRFLKALRTDHVKLDERQIGDLIIAANSLSEQINYYNGNNEITGLWQSFFQWEPISILAQISVFDIDEIVSDFKLIKRELLFLQTDAERKIKIKDFLEALNKDVQDLNNKISFLPADIEIKDYFESTYPKMVELLNLVEITINNNDDQLPDDVMFIIQHHLFSQKLHNLLGLISDWVTKSKVQFEVLLSSYASNSPQYALFLTFLKLFKHAQDDLNTFTKRHLDFYYKDVLQLVPNKGISDHVHCIVEPHQETSPFAIEKGTAFIAGKDKEGRAKFYAATADTTINQIKIDSIYSGFKKDNHYFFQNLTEKNASGESFHAFTTEETEQIGVILASPLFFLRGGNRTIRLKFLKDGIAETIIEGRYLFYLSGAEEWLQILEPKMDDNIVELVLNEEMPAIVPFDNEIHEGVSINTRFPVLKIVSADGKLDDLGAVSIDVEIDVTNYNQFLLFSDTGLIDHNKKFEPFGPLPKRGRSMFFSCNEFFMKANSEGKFNIVKDDKETVNSSSTVAETQVVTADLEGKKLLWNPFVHNSMSHLTNGNWEGEDNWGPDEKYYMKNPYKSESNPTDEEINDIVYDYSNNPSLSKSVSGFSKITLIDSRYNGQAYLEKFIKAAKDKDNTNLPYVHSIDEISFDYKVPFGQYSVDFIQLHPKGTKNLDSTEFKIVQTIENDGELFIGLANVEPGNSVSLLFQMAEGTANPRQRAVELKWSYLDGNRWEYFEKNPVGDTSNGLTQSGLVQIKVPEILDLTNQTVLPSGLWWIKIEVQERVDAICQLVGIHSQALKAKLFDFEESGVEFEENLEGSVISKLFRPKNQIKKIEQPYPSFGGKVKESDDIFYMRTSERLRHKDRAITNWDYEKLILDNFPSVYRVKCLNHYRYEAESNINELFIHNNSAGYVTIIPVSKGISENVPVYWKPLVDLGTMKRIKDFLEEKSSPHVRIHVKPPKLEKLNVNFNVRYKDIPGADSQLFTQRLKDAINAYLSPWAYKTDDKFKFQSEIEKSELIHLIESQSYVDYLSEFKVDHILLKDTSIDEESTKHDVDKIIPSTPYSLFIPNDHAVLTIEENCCV